MTPKKIPGEAIRRMRHYKGLKQHVAGEKLGIGQQAYSKMENSTHVKAQKIHKAIKAFECSNDDFEKLNGYPPRKMSRLFKLASIHILTSMAVE